MKLVIQIAAGVFVAWLAVVLVGSVAGEDAKQRWMQAEVNATYEAMNK